MMSPNSNRTTAATAWPVGVSMGSLFWCLSAMFIHAMFLSATMVLALFMRVHWEWNPWSHPAMPITMFSFFFLHVIAVNLCVTVWAIGLWRSSHHMARYSRTASRAELASLPLSRVGSTSG